MFSVEKIDPVSIFEEIIVTRFETFPEEDCDGITGAHSDR